MADRGEPVTSCSEWHGDGTAGGHDVGSHLAAVAPVRAMAQARPGDPSLVGKARSGAAVAMIGLLQERNGSHDGR